MSDNTARRLRAFLEGSGVAPFWRWWSGELLAMAPWVRELLRPARAQLAFAQRAEEWVLYHWADGRWVELLHWGRGEPGSAEIPAAAAEAFLIHGHEVLLILPPQESLVRRVSVPTALAENLREAIGFELDRYTPYKLDQVYFDVRALTRDDARQQLEVEIGVVPRERAERVIERAGSCGVSVAALLPELPQGGELGLDLLPPDRRAAKGSDGRWNYLAPIGAVCLLAGIAVILPIWQKRLNVRALEPLVNEARARAEAAEAVHRDLLSRQAEYNLLLARKHARPMVIEVLDEATRILPDDTWVHLVELKSDFKNPAKNRELQVRGETGISGKLISVFEESRLFTQATYKSPVTKGQPGAGDVFHVAAEVKQRSVPEVNALPVVTELPAVTGAVALPSAVLPSDAGANPASAPTRDSTKRVYEEGARSDAQPTISNRQAIAPPVQAGVADLGTAAAPGPAVPPSPRQDR